MKVTSPSLLIVDDEPMNLLILEEALGDLYDIAAINDGVAALEHLFAGEKTDLILADVMMPNMDGFDLCRRLKADSLSDDEWAVMRRHAEFGRDAMVQSERGEGETASFLRYACQIAYGHREKRDSSGYQQGQSGESISLPARLMAAAYFHDESIYRRVSKPPIPHEQAVTMIFEGRSKHFDPHIAGALEEIGDDFLCIATNYSDLEAKSLKGQER